jgi:Arc/MetJ-type ribon-helix-helix transcriptional regulator
MRGIYTNVSDRMREALVKALQARWEESLRAQAAIRLTPCPPAQRAADIPPPPAGGHRLHQRHRPAPGHPDHPCEAGEVDLLKSSQVA